MKEGLVARTWGNISIRVDDTHMLITPSGRTYEDLTPSDIVLVNYHTSKYEGGYQTLFRKRTALRNLPDKTQNQFGDPHPPDECIHSGYSPQGGPPHP